MLKKYLDFATWLCRPAQVGMAGAGLGKGGRPLEQAEGRMGCRASLWGDWPWAYTFLRSCWGSCVKQQLTQVLSELQYQPPSPGQSALSSGSGPFYSPGRSHACGRYGGVTTVLKTCNFEQKHHHHHDRETRQSGLEAQAPRKCAHVYKQRWFSAGHWCTEILLHWLGHSCSLSSWVPPVFLAVPNSSLGLPRSLQKWMSQP